MAKRRDRSGIVLTAIAALFLAIHIVELPATLEDLDSINFALGVRDYDVAKHQPHPPGYPIFTALGKISTGLLEAAGVTGAASRGLAIWGVLGGALAAFALFALFRRLEHRFDLALAATLVTMTAPLYWFTANRPLSDMFGLAAVLGVQALTVIAWVRQRDPAVEDAIVRRTVVMAAGLAGLVVGVRAQSFVLTLPLLAIVLFDWRVPSRRRALVVALGACAAGALLWAIPMLIASGGIGAYLAALGSQGAQDFSEATMLWTRPTVRVLLYALRDTFVLPWATMPLAAAVLSFAAVGFGVLAWRSRTALLLLAAGTLPYIAFHFLFQEAIHGKYALPAIPAIAYLAVVGIAAVATLLARRTPIVRGLTAIGAGLIVAASLWSAAPALAQYGATPSPIFHALSDAATGARARGIHPVIVTHWEAKRALDWPDLQLPGPVLKSAKAHEWLAPVRYWLGGGREPVWFLARPERTDLALIDHAHRTLAGRYRRSFDARVFTGGSRPNAIDWFEIASPGWFLDAGWSLTPEIAGVTKASGLGPHVQPVVGYVARRHQDAFLLIGGIVGTGAPRPADAVPVHIRVAIDDRPILEWDQVETWFLRTVTLPAGALAGDDAFARLSVKSSNAGDAIPVKLEQFDLQPTDALVWGFDTGWLEPEYDPARELNWRWSSGKATFNIHNAGRAVTIRMRGDSPRKYFDAAPHVTLTAAGRTLASFSPDRDFSWEIVVPADALAASQGLVVLETDRTFNPPNGDPRTLGLKFFDISIQ